jgi:hypothetical protein
MIVQRRGTSLLLITQPDHAALSASLMRQWRDGGLPAHPRRESILLAVREHDNGWSEVDASPLLDPSSGHPFDFMNAPAAVRRGIWPRGVERLSRDPWAAALVAQHAIHVYRRYGADTEWDPFFAEMEALRHRYLRAAAPLTLDHLGDYFFVRMGDLLSLTFCNAWSEGPEQPGYTILMQGGRVTVTPDPFAGTELHLSIDARELPAHRFESGSELARVFAASPSVTLSAVFGGGETRPSSRRC